MRLKIVPETFSEQILVSTIKTISTSVDYETTQKFHKVVYQTFLISPSMLKCQLQLSQLI